MPGSSVHGFPRQEYWSGLPCRPPGDLPDPGIELTSLTYPALAGKIFNTSATWEVLSYMPHSSEFLAEVTESLKIPAVIDPQGANGGGAFSDT